MLLLFCSCYVKIHAQDTLDISRHRACPICICSVISAVTLETLSLCFLIHNKVCRTFVDCGLWLRPALSMQLKTSYPCVATKRRQVHSAKSIPHCPVVLCRSSSQQGCFSAITPMEICSSYRLAVTHHQYTATLATSIPHCPVVLCRSGSQQGCVSDFHLWRFALHTDGQ